MLTIQCCGLPGCIMAEALSRAARPRTGRRLPPAALVSQVLDGGPHLGRVPRGPVVACGQPGHAGVAADGDHLNGQVLRAVLLAQLQQLSCHGH